MSKARRIVEALGGEWRGRSGLAPCPLCQPEGRRDQRGLSVAEDGGRTLVHCHKSGCAVWPELQRRGLAETRGEGAGAVDPAEAERRRREERRREAQRLRAAHELFASGVSCEGTPAQTYLEGRGIRGLKFNRMRNTLRFVAEALHAPSGLRLPAMVAQVRGPKGEALGIHRTFLQSDGSGKAEAQPAKMMLGPSAGGAVRFGPDAPVIALAEGLETALSIAQASRLTVWACLSTSGLKGCVLPPLPLAGAVVIAADHDEAGLAAAQGTAARLEAEGRAVSVIRPPQPGTDWNDVLRGEA